MTPDVGMANVVTSLTNNVGATQLWGTISEAIPYIAVIAIFALGWGILRKLLKGSANSRKLKV